MSTLLSIENLSVTVAGQKILDGVSLQVPKGKIIGLVGGSGSGKTTLGLSILDLLPQAMHRSGGRIVFNGKDIAAHTPEQLRQCRGGKIAMVFQEPLSAFDALFTIGYQMDETLSAHTDLTAVQRRQRIIETLQSVEIDDPERIFRSYPHQLSGGLRQRAMIAQAIVCHPQLIIADEPTSSLDVTIQARILKLLRKLNQERGMAVLLIAHDLGLVSYLADEAAVMCAGKIVEQAPAKMILERPQHAYTKALVEAF